tara:strand:- start:43 stop:291 length:249 start_codon:yes stop_codon:yes gene_type:complete
VQRRQLGYILSVKTHKGVMEMKVEIKAKHLEYLLKEVEEMEQFCTLSFETNSDIRYNIKKLQAILAARMALNKCDTNSDYRQ